MAKQIGANPFTATQIEQARNLVKIGQEVQSFLARCKNCGLSTEHLATQVQAVVDGMGAICNEFGNDCQPG